MDRRETVVRILLSLGLLIVSLGANAESGDSVCDAIYPKSGATQGTPSCPLITAGNTPTNMGNYYCVSDATRINRWCGTPPDSPAERSCPVADPVYPGSGAVTVSETDFASGDQVPLFLKRYYRARPLARGDAGFGALWSSNWQRRLNVTNMTSSPAQVIANRDNGDPVAFNSLNGGWRVEGGEPFTLVQGPSGWTLTDLLNNFTESYSTQGVLLSVGTHEGVVTTLKYSDAGTPPDIAPAPGLLIAISEHAPNSDSSNDLTIGLRYDAQWRITQMADPTGAVTRYGYDDNDNLTSVTWPDGSMRHYVYEDPRFTAALTGVIDETGLRVSTWTYDGTGRAITVTHPDTNRNVAFTYSGSSTVVTTSQSSATVNLSSIEGALFPTGDGAGYNMVWDTSGNLTSNITPYGVNAQYSYDDASRPVQATVHDTSGAAITSVTYADPVSFRPYMVASPSWLRTYVYDSNGNPTGIGEQPTTDLTGAEGFRAKKKSDISSRSYGLAYNASNQLTSAQRYDGGVLTGQWAMTRDQTGNLASIVDKQTGTTISVTVRDSAHRAITIEGPGYTANPAYDERGRLATFKYDEYPSLLNGNLQRTLKVTYTYAANGLITGRNGTVSTNGGADVPISSEETGQWLDNFEAGVTPAGPPANLVGWFRRLPFEQELGLEPVCPECAIYAGARVAWLVFQFATDPMWAPKNGIQQAAEAKQCKPSGANTTGGINFKTAHYASRLEKDGVNVADAESQTADVVNAMKGDMLPGTWAVGRFKVDGVLVEYRAFIQSDGIVSVGSIFPVH